MCIIVYKPEGISMPDSNIIANCFRTNPDGAGFMYPLKDKGKVRVLKGFMSLKDFESALDSLGDMTHTELVMHFRIGTQGLNSREMTHPFPVTDSEKSLKATNSFSDVALVHNGIIDLTTTWGAYSKGNTKERNSDTFYFVRDYASLIIRDKQYHEDKRNLDLLERLADSKLTIMTGDGDVHMIGNFIMDEDDHCFYSNSSYLGGGIATYSPGIGSITKSTDDYLIPDAWYGHFGYEEDEDGGVRAEDIVEMIPTKTQEGVNHRKVLAAYVPGEYYILDEDDGSIVHSYLESYVYDQYGHVYLFDHELNALIPQRNLSVVNESFDYVDATPRECVLMWTVFEGKE